MKNRKQRKTRHFTLIELLVVVAIMIVLLGITAPAFSKITRGRAVDTASRMISSQLMLARAEAISRRKYVAVIIPGHNFVAPTDGTYHYGSFRSAFVKKITDMEYEFDGWVEGTSWTFLPLGAFVAYIDYKEDTPSSLKYVVESNSYEPSDNFNWFTGGESEDKHQKDDDPKVKVTEKSGASGDKKFFEDGNPQTTGVRAIIFKPNGQCSTKVDITLMEGVLTPGSNSMERINEPNIHVIDVSNLTGQMKYLM